MFFTPSEYKAFDEILDPAKLSGIGVLMDVDASTKYVRAFFVVPDAPADKAGMKSGDLIEVELEIDALPGVRESAVIGLPHPDFGEGVTAVVVAKPGAALSEEAIIESIKTRLARYKVPKRILLVEELPRNAMGKVQKNALRKTFAAIYADDTGGVRDIRIIG